MKINEITVEQIREGKNWKVVNSNEFAELELEDMQIAEQVEFSADDYVVYSAIFVTDAGSLTPRVMIKEVGTPEHGGDMCDLIEGTWQRAGGANPNPDSPVFGNGYIANPLPNDPSFDTGDPNDDEWAYNREEFKRWAEGL